MVKSYLVDTHPNLVKEWHPTNNKKITPENITAGSNRKVWWLGECGHEWEAAVSNRTVGASCPYCSNRKILTGFNDLQSLNPNLASEWHPTLNGNTTANQVMQYANRKVWWLCNNNHEWEATIANRNKLGRGCPYCSGQKATSGINDLQTLEPIISKELHPLLNDDQNIRLLTQGSKRKVWWLGECGHEWEETVQNRVRKRYGCPVCSNRKVSEGFNDLATTHPDIAFQWHPTDNLLLVPSQITVGSNRKVWWKCEKGHEWEAVVYSRQHSGCPTCNVNNYVSKSENMIAEYLKSLNLNIEQSNRSILKGQELDIYVPEKNIAVEFNGLYWHDENHKPKTYHYDKWLACKEQGIQLIQIWEDDWKRNSELVKNMLAHKLGVSKKVKIYARDTKVEFLTLSESNIFLKQNHIQGGNVGSYYVGLKHKNNLVAVLVLKKENNDVFQIIRYATSSTIVGGFSKLIQNFQNFHSVTSYITFSDHTVSDGKLYANNGFKNVKELPVDYMYIVNHERKHKFGYRLKKFRNDPNLRFEENLTEAELAQLNGLTRIWDAGKTKWEKQITTVN